MALEFAQRVHRIPVYPLASGYDLGDEVALLASNESAFAPVPEVFEAVEKAVLRAHRYPDPAYAPLRRALSDRYGVAPERIALGNGSCDILLAAAEALLEPGAEVVYAWPAFSIYPHLAASSGARAIEVPLDADDRHDLDAIAREITVATRLVLVCNPNNPTSTSRGLDEIVALLDRCPPHACVILDEAYAEFSLALGDTYASVELLRRWPNLVVLRSFSKVYGLAGLRAGYALCGSPEFRQAVDQVRQPFHLNVAAQAAATEALRHQDAVEQRVTHTLAARLELEQAIAELSLRAAPSDANFLWVHMPDGEEAAERERALVAGLAQRRVLVRAGASLGGPGAVRVTVGTPEENRRFIAALRELL
ncbi:MAG: histidinol-phosphate transaminase [Solirubrobacterales bacterium]|nr:histidinol-phosphate transaminase [Solirubrobacterales bacterium]MBV9166672.1 histidinol-phosphate transaminase [Solirubrobacterales bacterium]